MSDKPEEDPLSPACHCEQVCDCADTWVDVTTCLSDYDNCVDIGFKCRGPGRLWYSLRLPRGLALKLGQLLQEHGK